MAKNDYLTKKIIASFPAANVSETSIALLLEAVAMVTSGLLRSL
jgi:hypothetical protein